ncbi:hypothetical protein Tco_0606252 [Tanacetum coccineum]
MLHHRALSEVGHVSGLYQKTETPSLKSDWKKHRLVKNLAIAVLVTLTIVGIKSLLKVTAVKLVLLVQKLLLLVLKVNAAGIKVTTAERLQLLKG